MRLEKDGGGWKGTKEDWEGRRKTEEAGEGQMRPGTLKKTAERRRIPEKDGSDRITEGGRGEGRGRKKTKASEESRKRQGEGLRRLEKVEECWRSLRKDGGGRKSLMRPGEGQKEPDDG